ncbi:MAG: OmpA family protein [Natronohydrobacter sp.]|nr:OmpA family protein [Natronohydrobacter sp.]
MTPTLVKKIVVILFMMLLPTSSVSQTAPVQEMEAEEFITLLTPPDRTGIRTRSIVIVPRVDMAVTFEYNSTDISPSAHGLLSNLAAALLSPKLADEQFRLIGHTDAIGSDAFNDNLSLLRAKSVRDHLISTFAVPPQRLTVEGRGKRQLLFPDRPEAAENRRVEISTVLD